MVQHWDNTPYHTSENFGEPDEPSSESIPLDINRSYLQEMSNITQIDFLSSLGTREALFAAQVLVQWCIYVNCNIFNSIFNSK